VINLSLAGPADELLARLLRHAIAQGRIVVGAVPDDGSLGGFPLGVAGVIAVDATGRPGRSGVLRAPGHDILTLVPGGHYDFSSGSSLAAAHVSGVVALLLAVPDAPRPGAVRALLEGSRPGPGGSGSISACGALAALRQATGCTAAQTR
jgi:subtilisin family serine protease